MAVRLFEICFNHGRGAYESDDAGDLLFCRLAMKAMFRLSLSSFAMTNVAPVSLYRRRAFSNYGRLIFLPDSTSVRCSSLIDPGTFDAGLS